MADVIHAWHPDVPLVQEVLHAQFEHHAYPSHTHDSWTVLLVDQGTVTYDLDRHEHRTTNSTVTLLPPQVPHDGRSATPDVPFRKRVLYLEPEWLSLSAVDAAAEAPTLFDPSVTSTVDQIHAALNDPADVLAAECGVLALRELVQPHLKSPVDIASDKPLARRLRHLLDDRLDETFTIAEAAA
ncbi:MAG: AraC family ligand binding domain-containing protein, partial [Brevibacterium aurantiacum]